MKIYQEPSEFNPINVVLETKEEAETFISLVDKIDMNKKIKTKLNDDERKLITKISNIITNNNFNI